jgi:DNA-binding GntR family transcriptional regulator
VRAEIKRLGLGPGSRLPSAAVLAERFASSPAAVRKALECLEAAEELVRQGRGRPVLVAGPGGTRALSAAELVEALSAEIADGRWPAGAPFATPSALACRFRTGVAVARAAVELLAARGLLLRQGAGRPTLVAGADTRPTVSASALAASLRREIAERRPEAGAELPTQIELARRFETSRDVAQAAVVLLAASGHIVRRGRGRPPVVADTARGQAPSAERPGPGSARSDPLWRAAQGL